MGYVGAVCTRCGIMMENVEVSERVEFETSVLDGQKVSCADGFPLFCPHCGQVHKANCRRILGPDGEVQTEEIRLL